MLAFDPLVTAMALQLVSFQCESQPAPSINISSSSDSIQYEYRLSQRQLGNKNIDTVSPYGHQAATVVGGLMSGEIEVSSQIELSWITHRELQQNCFWYNNIDIQIKIDPKIYIAREHKKGTCEHNAVHNHELKHVNVDRRLVSKYQNILKNHLQKVVRKIPVYGPTSSRQTPRVRKELTNYIEKAIEQVTDKMYTERRQQQQAIDSLEEYERVRKECE